MSDPQQMSTGQLLAAITGMPARGRRAYRQRMHPCVGELARRADPNTIPALQHAVRETFPMAFLGHPATEVLSRMGHQRFIIDLLMADPDAPAYAYFKALKKWGVRPPLPVILDYLHRPHLDARRVAIIALEFYDARLGAEPLIALLDDPEPRLQRSATFVLGQLRAPKAIPALHARLGRLSEDDWAERIYTIAALAKMQDEAILDDAIGYLQQLRKGVEGNYREAVTYNVVYAVANWAHPRIIAELTALLLNPLTENYTRRWFRRLNTPVTRTALENARLRRMATGQLLCELTDGPNPGQAAREIGRRRAYRAIPHLLQIAERWSRSTPQEKDRLAQIGVALSTMGAHEIVLSALRQMPAYNQAAIYLLPGLDGAPEAVCATLTDMAERERNDHRRRVAIEALGRNRYRPAASLLLWLLREDEPHMMTTIIIALGDIGDERASKPLAEKLPMLHFNQREHIVKALINIGGRQAHSALMVYLWEYTDGPLTKDVARTLVASGSPSALQAVRAWGRRKRDR